MDDPDLQQGLQNILKAAYHFMGQMASIEAFVPGFRKPKLNPWSALLEVRNCWLCERLYTVQDLRLIASTADGIILLRDIKELEKNLLMVICHDCFQHIESTCRPGDIKTLDDIKRFRKDSLRDQGSPGLLNTLCFRGTVFPSPPRSSPDRLKPPVYIPLSERPLPGAPADEEETQEMEEEEEEQRKEHLGEEEEEEEAEGGQGTHEAETEEQEEETEEED